METLLWKECVVNATLMAKLVRPAEGIPPGVTSTVRHNSHCSPALPHEVDIFHSDTCKYTFRIYKQTHTGNEGQHV